MATINNGVSARHLEEVRSYAVEALVRILIDNADETRLRRVSGRDRQAASRSHDMSELRYGGRCERHLSVKPCQQCAEEEQPRHTQGKWEAHTAAFIKYTTVTIGDVAIEIRTPNPRADAALIAAAPELLAAAQKVIARWDQLIAALPQDNRIEASESGDFMTLRAAISKATAA